LPAFFQEAIMKKILAIAALAHVVNAAYCAALGDTSQVAWDAAPQWQKDSAVLGVKLHLENPEAGPKASHESWLAHKTAEGWTYGEVKDEAAKTHPCFRPFEELAPEQQAKDHIFRAAVLAGAALYEAVEVEPDTVTKIQTRIAHPGKVPVKYVGLREIYADGVFGTGLTFIKDESQMVPESIAILMFRHAAVYVPGEEAAAVDTPIVPKDLKAEAEGDLQDLRDQIAIMDKAALTTYAKTNFQVDFAKNQPVEKLRTKLVALLDQFGV
jgi:hypothetical protein